MHPDAHSSTVPVAGLKQPKCPSAEDWVKIWSMYTMEYYPTIKRMKFCRLLQYRWAQGIMLEVNKSDREDKCIHHLHVEPKTTNSSEHNRKEADSQMQKGTNGHQWGKLGRSTTGWESGGTHCWV